jgi:hypothetical protein
MTEDKIRRGYTVVPAALMMWCHNDVKEELFGTTRTCGGCYLDSDPPQCKECLVDGDEVIVPKSIVAILKMNQVKLGEI